MISTTKCETGSNPLLSLWVDRYGVELVGGDFFQEVDVFHIVDLEKASMMSPVGFGRAELKSSGWSPPPQSWLRPTSRHARKFGKKVELKVGL